MQHEAANRLREHLGDATGIAVRTAKKYLAGRGIEVVPGGGFKPTATVFYRGDAVGQVKQTGAGEWVACGRPYPRFDAAVLVTTASYILTGK